MTDPIRNAERHLSARDPVLARLIERHGPCPLASRKRDPFHVLTVSIINQQLSTKAAETIQNRVAQAVGADGRFRPAHFLAAAPSLLRACGLSTAKARWLSSLAQAVERGELSFRRLARMDDDAALQALDALPGVGPWTAEMVLIFALNRLDVFSLGDAGLRRAVDRLYGNGRRLSDRRTAAIARAWSPYRSVASWYLWRLSDAEPAVWS